MNGIDPSRAPSGPGCVECEVTQSWWFHLRRCAPCGHVGCCDSSPGQHAGRHAAEFGHRFVRSFEPGEEWFWDYRIQVMYERGPELTGPAHHPAGQPAPGPAGRVPDDWVDQLHE
ncbi:UBP-type zinc finger domain-containing protein [Amycolatopsis sp. NPDC004747]